MKSILVADDDRHMAKTLCAILRRQGWDTTEVHSGEAAVEAASARRFAVVLMDVRMPGLNGVEAFRTIRQSQPRTPVILMTAYAAPELLAEAEREGVLRILPKPIPWATLTGLLGKVTDLDGSVLIVDHDPEFLRTLNELLSSWGRDVRHATSLEEAITLLEERTPQVVMLDLVLDGLGPRDTVLAIREVSPTVALILCSGQLSVLDEALAELPAHWIYAGLTKPFSPDRLLQLLDGVPRE